MGRFSEHVAPPAEGVDQPRPVGLQLSSQFHQVDFERPAGDGRISAVARDDVADVAVAVLLDRSDRDHGQTYALTGPAAISLDDVAEAASAVAGRVIRYHAETLDEAYAAREKYQRPRFEVEGWVTTYVAISTGELARVSDAVPRLTRHPATSMNDVMRRHPESYAHLL